MHVMPHRIPGFLGHLNPSCVSTVCNEVVGQVEEVVPCPHLGLSTLFCALEAVVERRVPLQVLIVHLKKRADPVSTFILLP